MPGVTYLEFKYRALCMNDPVNNDNKYPRGMFIYAKENPELKLIIDDYKQRAYFCAVVDHPELKLTAYFERELIDPKQKR